MSPSHLQNNDASRQRLQALIASLDESALRETVRDDWTVSAILAHMAFWDQNIAVRWETYARSGHLQDIAPGVIDTVNAANLPAWRALPGTSAADLALRASEEVDSSILRLSAEDVDLAVNRDCRYLVDRSGHRTTHLDEIEGRLGR